MVFVEGGGGKEGLGGKGEIWSTSDTYLYENHKHLRPCLKKQKGRTNFLKVIVK